MMEKSLSAAAGENSDADFQGDFRVGQFLFRLAAASECSAKGAGKRDAGERRRNIGAIIYILIEQAAFAGRAAGFANQFYGINLKEQSCGTSGFGGFGVEDVGLAEGERDGMELAGAFVEQVAEVGGGSVSRCDGEVHVRQLYREESGY